MDSDDRKITQLTRVTSLSDSDLFVVVTSIGTAPVTKAIEKSNAIVGVGGFNDGFMTNGKIQVTVASNNITVAIKTLAGSDPSSSDKVTVRIGNTLREITSALSVTKNAGTNWCNAGSAELATKEIDYFVYIIWNTTPATDVIDIGFSRIPYGRVYSDFSGTTTNEKYLAYGNGSAPTSTDDVVNIGRFAATLSAGAGYTWTVPTFTSVNLIQHPIYETRPLTWQPAYSASGSMTWTSVTTNLAEYQIIGRICSIEAYAIGTTGGTANVAISMTLPFNARNVSQAVGVYARVGDGGAKAALAYVDAGTPNILSSQRYDAANFGLGASRYTSANGKYMI